MKRVLYLFHQSLSIIFPSQGSDLEGGRQAMDRWRFSFGQPDSTRFSTTSSESQPEVARKRNGYPLMSLTAPFGCQSPVDGDLRESLMIYPTSQDDSSQFFEYLAGVNCLVLLGTCITGLFQMMSSHPKTSHLKTWMLWSSKRSGTCPSTQWLLLRPALRMRTPVCLPCHHRRHTTNT